MVWQAAVSIFDIEPFILPAPTAIGHEAVTGASGLFQHTAATLQLTLVGFMIGTAIGLVISLALHMVPFLKTALYPLLILSQNVPTIALAPLLMIWFGFGMSPKVIVITLVCFFPVAVAALDGLARTDRTMMNYMQMAGLPHGKFSASWSRRMPFPPSSPGFELRLPIRSWVRLSGNGSARTGESATT